MGSTQLKAHHEKYGDDRIAHSYQYVLIKKEKVMNREIRINGVQNWMNMFKTKMYPLLAVEGNKNSCDLHFASSATVIKRESRVNLKRKLFNHEMIYSKISTFLLTTLVIQDFFLVITSDGGKRKLKNLANETSYLREFNIHLFDEGLLTVDIGVDGSFSSRKECTAFAMANLNENKKFGTIYRDFMRKPVGPETFYPAFLNTSFGGIKMIPGATAKSVCTKLLGYSNSKNPFYKRDDSGDRHGKDFHYKNLHTNLFDSGVSQKLRVNIFFQSHNHSKTNYLFL